MNFSLNRCLYWKYAAPLPPDPTHLEITFNVVLVDLYSCTVLCHSWINSRLFSTSGTVALSLKCYCGPKCISLKHQISKAHLLYALYNLDMSCSHHWGERGTTCFDTDSTLQLLPSSYCFRNPAKCYPGQMNMSKKSTLQINTIPPGFTSRKAELQRRLVCSQNACLDKMGDEKWCLHLGQFFMSLNAKRICCELWTQGWNDPVM